MNYQYAIKEPLSMRLYSPVQQTGFKYREMDEGAYFSTGNKDFNHILFVLDGSVRISCNEFSKKIIHKNEFVLIPIAADVICKAIVNSRVLFFSFDALPLSFNKLYLPHFQNYSSTTPYSFAPLPIRAPLEDFIDLLLILMKDGLNKPIMHEIKEQELFIVLQSFYNKKENMSLFHPIISDLPDFRLRIMRGYRKISHVKDFAKLLHMESKTFSRQFKIEFGISPYQWLLNQKAKHVHFSLAESDLTLDEIRQEHGFKFPGHFTRFCKEQYNCTPLQLRKRLYRREIVM